MGEEARPWKHVRLLLAEALLQTHTLCALGLRHEDGEGGHVADPLAQQVARSVPRRRQHLRVDDDATNVGWSQGRMQHCRRRYTHAHRMLKTMLHCCAFGAYATGRHPCPCRCHADEGTVSMETSLTRDRKQNKRVS